MPDAAARRPTDPQREPPTVRCTPSWSTPAEADGAEERREAVEEPAKVMRIGSMVKQLLEEVRGAELDEAARGRLKEIYETSLSELGSRAVDRPARGAGPGDHPLRRRRHPPSEPELRIAQAQLVGWLEGLFHGIQATLFAQQMAARQQLERCGQSARAAAGRQGGPGGPGGTGPSGPDARPGTYL